MTARELYEATRGYWRVSLRKAERAEYALSVWGGVVRAVYKIEKWLPAGTVPRPTLPDAETPTGRYAFAGRCAEGDIRDKYMGRSMAGLFQKGEANPIKYFFRLEDAHLIASATKSFPKQ